MGCCESSLSDSTESIYNQDSPEPRRHNRVPHQNHVSGTHRQVSTQQQGYNVVLPQSRVLNGDSQVSTPQQANNNVPRRRRVLNIHELLAEQENIDLTSAKNIVNLFENEDTIPFVCRYRRDLIGWDTTPDKLRDIKINYTEIVGLKRRAEAVIKELEGLIDLTGEIKEQILSVKSMKELEFLCACYKKSKKHAKHLEAHAYRLMLGQQPPVQLETLLDQADPNLNTLRKVQLFLICIISNQFSKHPRVLEVLQRVPTEFTLKLKCTKLEADINDSESTLTAEENGNNGNESYKFEPYFNCENNIRTMKPHQVLAINRGEKSKFLTVQIEIPDECRIYMKKVIDDVFLTFGTQYPLRSEICEKGFQECYNRSLKPLLCNEVRADLTAMAERAAIKVFADNLRQLLLTPPLKGERILGIDPGFSNGCKLALISETAQVLEVGVLHPHDKKTKPEVCGVALANMLKKHNCTVIALGNGTACRETEVWLTEMFAKGILNPETTHYTIVSEHGASVYSCSKEAQKEFPNHDLTIISAISIARRLNNPLSEYVKIEPRNLGVGMYQHDIDKKKLNKTLKEVVSECVSFVGVDINTTSHSLLKHVAGMNEECAEKIIEYRKKNGPFYTRRDLLNVHSIGKKRFQQCAGFIRIDPKSVGNNVPNMLDCTWVHPESYNLATKIIKQCNLNVNDVGTSEFIAKIREYTKSQSPANMARDLNIQTERLQVVLDALQRELSQDYRPDFDKKLFRTSITKFNQISVGCTLTGKVMNVVDFGAFVDVGLENNSLIHNNHMKGIKLRLGDRVSAEVTSVDIPRQLVKLKLLTVL